MRLKASRASDISAKTGNKSAGESAVRSEDVHSCSKRAFASSANSTLVRYASSSGGHRSSTSDLLTRCPPPTLSG